MLREITLGKTLAAGLLLSWVTGYAAAAAPSLTGTWEGRWNCKILQNGEKAKDVNNEAVLEITHVSDTEVRAQFFEGVPYEGFAIGENTKPEQGALALVFCPAGADEVITWKFKAGPDSATLKGTSAYNWNYAPDNQGIGTCKYKFKRVDTQDPMVAAC